jgi:hypothetical protein
MKRIIRSTIWSACWSTISFTSTRHASAPVATAEDADVATRHYEAVHAALVHRAEQRDDVRAHDCESDERRNGRAANAGKHAPHGDRRTGAPREGVDGRCEERIDRDLRVAALDGGELPEPRVEGDEVEGALHRGRTVEHELAAPLLVKLGAPLVKLGVECLAVALEVALVLGAQLMVVLHAPPEPEATGAAERAAPQGQVSEAAVLAPSEELIVGNIAPGELSDRRQRHQDVSVERSS